MLFHVIVELGNHSYYSQVEAESNAGAEHMIIDKGYCGRHGYGVNACLAFSCKDIDTDTFCCCLCTSKPVSLPELYALIAERNAELASQDRAEKRIEELEDQIKDLTAELKALRGEDHA